MTQGIGLFFTNDKVYQSVNFNGDMYPEENGDIFWYGVKTSKTPKEFSKLLTKFNKKIFSYEEKLLTKFNIKEVIDKYEQEELLIDFRNNYFQRFFADWIFIKNKSNKTIKIITNNSRTQTLTIEPNNSLRFRFGKIEGQQTFKYTKEFYSKIQILKEKYNYTEQDIVKLLVGSMNELYSYIKKNKDLLDILNIFDITNVINKHITLIKFVKNENRLIKIIYYINKAFNYLDKNMQDKLIKTDPNLINVISLTKKIHYIKKEPQLINHLNLINILEVLLKKENFIKYLNKEKRIEFKKLLKFIFYNMDLLEQKGIFPNEYLLKFDLNIKILGERQKLFLLKHKENFKDFVRKNQYLKITEDTSFCPN